MKRGIDVSWGELETAVKGITPQTMTEDYLLLLVSWAVSKHTKRKLLRQPMPESARQRYANLVKAAVESAQANHEQP